MHSTDPANDDAHQPQNTDQGGNQGAGQNVGKNVAQTAIAVEGVEKIFGHDSNRVVALDKVSVTIHENEFFTLLGPSGCSEALGLDAARQVIHPRTPKPDRRPEVVFPVHEDEKSRNNNLWAKPAGITAD